MRVIFLGTPEYSIPVLSSLFDAGHELLAVVSRSENSAGRGQITESPPTAKWARERGIPVLQPTSLRSPEVIAKFQALRPDVMVVAAYGLILPTEILSVPVKGCLNVHPSLLPKFRGSSPVVETLLHGEKVTGISIMLLDEGMDTGPIVVQEKCPVQDEDTSESLTTRMFERGAELLARTLPAWIAGEIEPIPQDDSLATYSRRMSKSDGNLDFTLPAKQLSDRIRALTPWPGTYTHWNGKLLKFLKAVALSGDSTNATDLSRSRPGKVVSLKQVGKPSLAIVTSDGLLGIIELQLEGRKPNDSKTFLQGHADFLGTQLPS